jgi:DNA-directed RNA polymerase sigma subunit (sigma70/sigma32)
MQSSDKRVLDQRECAGLEYRAGIHQTAQTFEEVGKQFGVCSSRARMTHVAAIRKLAGLDSDRVGTVLK